MVARSEGFDRLDFGRERVVEEDFVDDEGQIVASAEGFERRALRLGGGVTGGVVGVDQQNGARAGCDATLELGEIDPPAEVVEERVRLQADIVEGGEEIEQRIAGLGDEDFVSGIAQQAKKKGVRFAGAGGEDQILRWNVSLMASIVLRNGGAGGWDAARVGVVEGGRGD